MRHRDFSFTLALCASLVVHGWLISEGILGIRRQGLHAIENGYRSPPLLVAVKDDDELGGQDGKGDAIDEAPGETPMQARQAEQTQILGSLDPEGAGAFRDRPSMSVLPTGGAVVLPQPDESSLQAPTLGVAATPLLEAPRGYGDVKAKTSETPAAKAQPSPPQQPTSPALSQQQSAVASIAGAPMPSADPAPQAATESDPVSVQGGAFFRNGKAIVQLGRKHKLTSPRLTLAARTDLLQLPSPVIVVLRMKLDASGTVTNVEIFQSSGSNDIDQTCRIEAYNWWLEPKRDKSGKAVPDEFLFTLRFS